MQIGRICASHLMIAKNPRVAPNGGSARGYHEPRTSLTA